MNKKIIAVLTHNPVIILIVMFIILLTLYFIASPYQICLRLDNLEPVVCLKITSW